MGLFAGIKTVLGIANSGGKGIELVEKTAGGIYKGLDMLKFTEEEKSIANKEIFKLRLDFLKQTQNENSDQSKARRDIAIMTFRVFFSLIFILLILWRVDPEWCRAGIEIVKTICGNPLLLMVAGIYFGPYQVSKVWSKKK